MTGADSQELDEIRSLARDFAQAELRPHVEQWDHDRNTGDALHGQLAELGFFGIAMPERFGGMELGTPSVLAIIEELANGEASVALSLAMHAKAATLLMQSGSNAHQTKYLEKMSSGDVTACIAIAEENGADLAEVMSTATKTATGYTLNGTKRWVSNAATANVCIVAAKLDNAVKLFIVDMNTAGVDVTGRDDTLGLRPMQINTVTFKDCNIAEDALISDAKEALNSTAMFDQLATAAIATGIARAALEHATGYAAIREQFSTPLKNFEGIQYKLADMATCTAAASALLQQAAHSGDEQQARMAKLFATTAAMEVTTQAVQIYGGYGYMRDYPVEKLMRDAKAMEILGGANEHLRVAIAQALY